MEREGWNRRYETSELLWTARPNRFLVSEVEGMRPGSALDLGTGEGRNAVWLAEQGWQVTAVDFSDVGLAKARRLAEERAVEVRWVQADLRFHHPEGTYDLVVVLYLHLPAEDRGRVHEAAARALRVGGTLLVVGHDRTNLTEGCGGPQDPAILFSPPDVADDVAGVPGIEIVRAEPVTRQVATDSGERKAIDALVRAVRTS